jgi:hypothetical protein
MVTESSTAPAANATGWTATAPANYTFASAGAKTLYGWAKDAAGNVSAPLSAMTTITLAPNPTTPTTPTTPTCGGQPTYRGIQSGYAVVTPSSGGASQITVFETFGLSGLGGTSNASVFASGLTTEASLFVRTGGRLGRDAGFAVANPWPNMNSNITVSLRDSTGTLIGTDTFTLNALHQTSQFITELLRLNRSTDVTGTVTVTSSIPIAFVGLRFRGPTFSTLPVTSLVPPAPVPVISPGIGGPGAAVLPDFVAGGGWASQVVISNLGTTSVTVQLDLFKQDGTPLTTSLNGMHCSSFPGVVVPAGGVVVLAPLNQWGDDDF